jgi:hypothetical protein
VASVCVECRVAQGLLRLLHFASVWIICSRLFHIARVGAAALAYCSRSTDQGLYT